MNKLKRIPVIIYYMIGLLLSVPFVDLFVSFQEYLTREPGDVSWAPTLASYTMIYLMCVWIMLTVFGFFHLIFINWRNRKRDRKKEDQEGHWVMWLLLGVIPLVLFILCLPLTLGNYVAADERGFMHDPYWGWDRVLYPWEESRIQFDYDYYSEEDDDEGRELEVEPQYIIRHGEKTYDLWEAIVDADATEHPTQFEIIRAVDSLARKNQVPFQVKHVLGVEHESAMKQDDDFSPEQIRFLMERFSSEYGE